MKKILVSLIFSLGLVGIVLADCGSTFGPGGTCPSPITEKQVIPYFNTVGTHSSRFGITNPLNFPVLVNVTVFSVDGVQIDKLDVVLKPKAMMVSSLSGTETGSTFWFIPPDDVNCKSFTERVLPVSEGYLEITSTDVVSFGPVGFCSGDYQTHNPGDLYYEYSVWEGSRLVNDQKESFKVTNPTHSTWTAIVNRSTSIVLNKGNPSCEQTPYSVFSRDGRSSTGVTTLCGTVTVFSVGPEPFFTSKNNNSQVFSNVPFSAGWVEFTTSGTTLTIRSEF